MKEQDIRRILGDGWVKIPAPLLRGLPIPDESKDFLKSFGLPTREGLLLPFFGSPQEFVIWRNEGHDYLVLADQRGQKLALHIPGGQIYIIDSLGELPIRFVNSDVVALVYCLALYVETQTSFLASHGGDVGQVVSQLRSLISTTDAKALDNEENWWSVILDETEQELM